MCIIIVKYAGQHVSRKKLRHSWERNGDGGGFAYLNNEGQLVVDKGYFQFKEFYQSLRNAEKNHPHSHFIIHMRIATHGPVNEHNSHPHFVHDDLVMAHNGVLRCVGNLDKNCPDSDTVVFANTILANLPVGWEENAIIRKLVATYITPGNKLALMNSAGTVYIINKHQGYDVEGCWYSNESYKPAPVRVTAGFNNYADWRMHSYSGVVTSTPNRSNLLLYSGRSKCKKCMTPVKDVDYDREAGLCTQCLAQIQVAINFPETLVPSAMN